MPKFVKNKKWFWTDVDTIYSKKHAKSFSKLKAAWKGKKVRNQWYAGRRGTLHGGRFKRN